jgi:hypothetical protein
MATRLPGYAKGSTVGDAKQLIVKPISAKDGNRIIRALHYSGKVVNNSQVHLGVFMGDRCGGAMQFGPSLNKRKIVGLVSGTLWNEFIELNRLAFADWLPRNGESRCIAYAMKWLKKNYPWLKWVVSFADGTQCGDGTIYRASGFVLTSINAHTEAWLLPNGESVQACTLRQSGYTAWLKPYMTEQRFNELRGGATSSGRIMKTIGAHHLPGFQLRYIYFLDPTARDRLTVPILPFSEIERRGASMYKGQHIERPKQATGSDHEHSGGAAPTGTLQDA